MAEVAFPTIADVNQTLANVKNLVEDRNALIKFYFGDDIYKDFLLAERLQDIAEADRRDDTTSTSDVNFDQKEFYQETSTFKRFSNFLNPGDLRDVDLDPITPGIMGEAERANREKQKKQEESNYRKSEEVPTWLKFVEDLMQGGNPMSGGSGGQRGSGSSPTTRKAEGGVVSGTSALMPSMPSVSASGSSAASTTGSTSLKEAGFTDFSKNISNKLDESLDIDGGLKKALADAIALPLRAVAGGLMDLMSMIPVHTREQENLVKQNINYLSSVFGIPKAQLENTPSSSQFSLKQGDTTNTANITPGATSSSPPPGGNPTAEPNYPDFDPSKTYKTGDIVKKDGQLKKFDGQGWAAYTPGTGGGMLSDVSRAPASLAPNNSSTTSNSSFNFSPSSSSILGDTSSSSSFTGALDLQNISSNSFGGSTRNASELIANFVSMMNNPTLTENNISSISDRNPDLLDLTNQLEMDIIASQEEKTKFEVQSFAQATGITSPSVGSSTTSVDESSDGETELINSPFFEVYAKTSQFA